MPLIVTADRGWAPGQDVSGLIVQAMADAAAADPKELRLSAQYDIAGGAYAVPNGLTVSAVDGAGFTVTDPTNNQGVFSLGSNNTFRNLTVTLEGSIDFAPLARTLNPQLGTHFNDRIFAVAYSKTDFLMERCDIDYNGRIILQAENCDRFTYRRNRFRGGQWKVLPIASRDFTFDYNFFDAGPSEAIKTTTSNTFPALGCKGFTITNCRFQKNWRDGIDTTGGLMDSVIADCVFNDNDHGVGGGIDFKQGYDATRDIPQLDVRVRNVQVARCTFIDVAKAFVFSMVDHSGTADGTYAMSAGNVATYAVHNITITDTILAATTGYASNGPELALLKGAHTITFTNLQPKGAVNTGISNRRDSIVGAEAIKADGILNYGITTSGFATALPAEAADYTVPFAYGAEPGGELATFAYDAAPETPRFTITSAGVLRTNTDLGTLASTTVTIRATGPGGTSEPATVPVAIGA